MLKNRLAWCVHISCTESILLQMFSQIHINLAIWQLLKWKQISNHVVALTDFCMTISTYESCSALFDLNCNQLLGVLESFLLRSSSKIVQNSQEKACNGVLLSVKLQLWLFQQLFHRFCSDGWFCLLQNFFCFWLNRTYNFWTYLPGTV